MAFLTTSPGRALTSPATFGLLVVAIVVGFLLFNPAIEPEEVESGDTPIERVEPDLHGQNVLFSELRENGTLQYKLAASTISQFEEQALTRLQAPQLHLASEPPWDIASVHGYIRQRENDKGKAEEIVFLREEVTMIQHHPQNGVLTLRSDSMYIYPDREYAETDQDVIIDTEVGRTIAAGMSADMATGLLTLSSSPDQRVHTIVLPEQFKQP